MNDLQIYFDKHFVERAILRADLNIDDSLLSKLTALSR
jgi:hypothetical protein